MISNAFLPPRRSCQGVTDPITQTVTIQFDVEFNVIIYID